MKKLESPRKRLVALAAGIAVLTVALSADAGPGGPGSRGAGSDGQNRLERMTEHLDLSDEQQDGIEKMLEASRAEHLSRRKATMRLENELRGALLADEPDQGTIVRLVREIGERRTEQQVARMKTRLAVRELLTPEQRDEMMFEQPGSGGPRGERSGRHPRGLDRDGPRRGSGGWPNR